MKRHSSRIIDRLSAAAGTIGSSRTVVRALCATAIAAIGVGAWWACAPIDQGDVHRSAAAASLMDLGAFVRADIARVVRPAMERTQKLAADPDLIEALRSGDPERRTQACNAAIRSSTEIDAIALFDQDGRIVAINSVYASGQPIPPDRVDRIMRLSFAQRDIIQKCVRNDADDQVLEFQTTCDITPALFDSTGLSIAYSVPVRDPRTGAKLGVASARLRFERLTDRIRSRVTDGRSSAIEFVTDRGEYFSEEINSGRASPPVPVETLARVVAPLVAGGADYSLTEHWGEYLSLFRLKGFATLEGGGIQVLLLGDERWLTHEIRQGQALKGGSIIGAGLLMLVVASLMRAMAAMKLSERAAVTERTVAQAALAELSAHKTALDQHALVSVMDAAGILTDVNEAYCRISGFPRADLIGKSHRALGSGSHAESFWEQMWHTIGRGAAWHGEVCQQARNGSLYWVDATIVPFADSTGAIVKYVTIGADLTERKKSEAERERANRAEAANQSKSEFLANMSHEIRTPLNGVVGLLDLLLGTELSADQRRYGKLAKASASLLTSVLGDILDLSKIEAGKLEIVATEFNLHDTVEEIMEMMGQPAAKKKLEIACQIDPGVPVIVRADAERLRQVIVNLVNNAIKFTERGSVVLRVTPESLPQGPTIVRFAVTDTGIGIPPDRLGRLFKAFSQADASTTRVYGGTGLGLAISKQLVALMGGAIGVESEGGRGSTFWFTISPQVPARPAPPTTPRPRLDPKMLRVLAIDDNQVQRDVLHQQLASWGIEAATAAGGEDALRVLGDAVASTKPFRLAIVDREMPGMDGFDFAMAVRSRRDLRGTALMITLSPQDAVDPNQLRGMGFSGHLTKPVRQSQLFDAIMVALADCERDTAPQPQIVGGPNAQPPRPEARAALRILVAEDNEVNQIVVREVLTKSGHRCDMVSDGKQAVEAVRRERYDAVLMDCQMPVMDGFEATRAIRNGEAQAGQGAHIPIVALTANAMKGDRERCLEAGMDGYASKPIDPKGLLRTIDQALGADTAVPRAA